jgi:hypothetical protein
VTAQERVASVILAPRSNNSDTSILQRRNL